VRRVHLEYELGDVVICDQFVARGEGGHGGVTSQTNDRIRDESMERLRALITAAVPRIGPQPDDECSTAVARARP
jgi:hypothetical protein